MAPQSSDVARLLSEAAAAPNFAEQQRLIGAAEDARGEIAATAAREREVDLAQAVVAERLTPVPVHEHHTAATDWMGDLDTTAPADAERNMVAQGSVWYAKLSELVKQHPDELAQQALGMAQRLAGQYGAGADAAEEAFLSHVGMLHARDVTAGLVTVAAATDGPGVQGEQVTLGLPAESTSSNRAPVMQELSGPHSDSGWPSSLELPQQDVDAANNDSGTQRDRAKTGTRKEAQMPHLTAACPECSGCSACGGTHRVAVRTQAASGLDQIDQIVDPHDNPSTTPYPTDVAFPWEMPNDSGQAIQETEKQLADREKLKGASRQQATRKRIAERAAHEAAQRAYLQVMGGQDDSGWLGDMGAGGVRPGMQDTGNPGNTFPGNIADPDPVYGYGGDQGDKQLKPYGADEADDYTNNPGMNWQPGQPTQYDQAGRGNQVGQATGARRSDNDPEIARALTYVRQRRALLDG